MRPVFLTLVFVILLASGALAQASVKTTASTPPAKVQITDYVRPNKKERVDQYFKSMFGLTVIGRDLASAGISTWTNSPREWGPHWDGFGKRFASNLGKGVIKNTTAFALEEAFKLDSRYYRITKHDAASKIKNALISPFTARNEGGKVVFGFPRIAGTYASSLISVKTWYPNRYAWKDGFRNGSVSLLTNALFNLVKEFVKKK